MKYLKLLNNIYNKFELPKKVKFYDHINFLSNNDNEII